MKIGIICFATNNYITFFEQYYKSFKQNFLPDIDKKFFVIINGDVSRIQKYCEQFIDSDCVFLKCEINDYNTAFIQKAYATAQICKSEKVKDCDLILNSNINFNCVKHITNLSDMYDNNKNATLIQLHTADNSQFDYEINPISSCYCDRRFGKHYIRGGLVFTTPQNMAMLYDNILELLLKDYYNGFKPVWNDESALNKIAYGNEQNFKILHTSAACPIFGSIQEYEKLHKESSDIDIYFSILEKRWFFKDYKFDLNEKFNFPEPYTHLFLTVYGILKVNGNKGIFLQNRLTVDNVEFIDNESIILQNGGKSVKLNYNKLYRIWY